jgi:acyl-CoA hydrolase
MKPKTPSESKTEATDIILPSQTNHHGTIFGGEVMSCVDRIGTIAAARHSGEAVVTASFDSMDFLSPIRLGEVIILRAAATWTGRTSMEVMVTIEGENTLTGERRMTGISFLTFVAVDEDGRPVPVPPLQPITEEERHQYELVKERAAQRKRRRQYFNDNRSVIKDKL